MTLDELSELTLDEMADSALLTPEQVAAAVWSYPAASADALGSGTIGKWYRTVFGGITNIGHWLGLLMGKTADSGTLAEVQANAPAASGYDNTTMSTQALSASAGTSPLASGTVHSTLRNTAGKYTGFTTQGWTGIIPNAGLVNVNGYQERFTKTSKMVGGIQTVTFRFSAAVVFSPSGAWTVPPAVFNAGTVLQVAGE